MINYFIMLIPAEVETRFDTITEDTRTVLVIPVYKEWERYVANGPDGLNIARALDRVTAARENEISSGEFGIVVVYDGDKGNTPDLIKDFPVSSIGYEQNRGRGTALKTGHLAVAGFFQERNQNLADRVFIYTDADGSYSPDTLLSLEDSIRLDGADMSVAFRQGDKTNQLSLNNLASKESLNYLLRKAGHVVMHSVCERIAATGQKDPQAGAKAFRGDVAQLLWSQVKTGKWAADREVLYLARKFGLKVGSVGATIETDGYSTVNVVRDSIDMVRDSWQIRALHKDSLYQPNTPPQQFRAAA